MKSFGGTVSKGMILLMTAASLTGCVTAAQTGYRGGTPIVDESSTVAAWDKLIASDRQLVSSGMLPPDVLKYDVEIAPLLPQAQSILATNDRHRARAWNLKLKTLMSARSDIIIKSSRAQTASTRALVDALGHGRPDPCLDPMGRNICASPPVSAGQQGGTHVCGAGPGPSEVQVGETPGGQGVGAEPLCDWVR